MKFPKVNLFCVQVIMIFSTISMDNIALSACMDTKFFYQDAGGYIDATVVSYPANGYPEPPYITFYGKSSPEGTFTLPVFIGDVTGMNVDYEFTSSPNWGPFAGYVSNIYFTGAMTLYADYSSGEEIISRTGTNTGYIYGYAATTYSGCAPTTCTSPRYPPGWQAWTDATITAGSTKLSAVHINQLRYNINLMRADAGLTVCSWTDPTLTSNVTKIRKLHLDEMRTCINQVYTTCGQAAPIFTEAVITAGSTKIKKVHMDELRSVTANAP